MQQNTALALLLLAFATAGAAPLSAHPHVWILMRSDVVFDPQGLITGINVEWTFDDGYTQMALDGLDTNGDGAYSQTELEPLTKENLASLKDYNYFVAPHAGAQLVEIGEVTEYGQIYNGKKLTLHFQLPLAAPVDPRKEQFYYKIYDPEFFIAMDYAPDDPVGIVGSLPQGCKLEVKPVVADEQIDQTRQMLSTKGTDWTPPADEDFGAMFAQPAIILCKT
jgi:ABC-type uncharacterized transport system substrate-binding protein